MQSNAFTDPTLSEIPSEELIKERVKLTNQSNGICGALDNMQSKEITNTEQYFTKVGDLIKKQLRKTFILAELESRDGKNHYVGSSRGETMVYKISHDYQEEENK